jgi:hypothetical protein
MTLWSSRSLLSALRSAARRALVRRVARAIFGRRAVEATPHSPALARMAYASVAPRVVKRAAVKTNGGLRGSMATRRRRR